MIHLRKQRAAIQLTKLSLWTKCEWMNEWTCFLILPQSTGWSGSGRNESLRPFDSLKSIAIQEMSWNDIFQNFLYAALRLKGISVLFWPRIHENQLNLSLYFVYKFPRIVFGRKRGRPRDLGLLPGGWQLRHAGDHRHQAMEKKWAVFWGRKYGHQNLHRGHQPKHQTRFADSGRLEGGRDHVHQT